MSVGSRMKERRESMGLTQVQLAELLGVTKGAVGNYETDANSPKTSILYKVFEVLQCDANYLFQDGDGIRECIESAASPDEMDHLVKKYRSLDPYGKEAVDGVLDVEYRRCGGERRTKAAAEIKAQKGQPEAAVEIAPRQKMPIPAVEDGLCDSEETLMKYVKKMNPGQQAMFLDQWRRLLGQQKESSTNAVQPLVGDKAPESEPPVQS